ncbi:MAG TPA: hypothetical protein VMS88_00060 [Terriglobales bacterium]|nr:hypothetical protein [Terriglobales bacterium]
MTRAPAWILAVALAASPCARAAESRGLVSTRALVTRLESSGRAEAVVRLARRDPLSGRTSTLSGRLALELPGCARLDLSDGEAMTLRPDGGDWLQPATRQLIHGGVRAVAGLLTWWGALLDTSGAEFRETKVAGSGYRLKSRAFGEELSQRVDLGANGLPRRVVAALSPEDSLEYRISSWRFTHPRGRDAFVLQAPRGYEVVHVQ